MVKFGINSLAVGVKINARVEAEAEIVKEM
jgi:hypothetical protein